MMRKILALMASGTSMAPGELAQALGVRPPEVEAMLRQLTELGYLDDLACQDVVGASARCSGCTARNGCHAGTPRHLWTLTSKGRRAGGMHLDRVPASSQP
jgi:predicted ArsR family transcriptional regulator